MFARTDLIDALAAAIAARVGVGVLRVGVDGPDAAGKSTLVGELAESLTGAGRPVVTVSLDGFHHPVSRRYRRGSLSAEGYYEDAVDYPAFRAGVLDAVGPHGDHRVRPAIHDLGTDAPLDPPLIDVAPGTVLLVDGVFLQRPELDGAWDLVVYLHVSPDETMRRDSPGMGCDR